MLSDATSALPTLQMLRVHIAALGFEIDRIVLPAKRMRADRVWLIVHSKPGEDMGTPFRIAVEKQLHESRVESRTIEADRTDLFDTLRALRVIIAQESGNAIFVNVSVGSKIQSIASTMACMMFKDQAMIRPYYAVPERYSSLPDRQETEGLREIVTLPEYKIEIPTASLVKCLKIISQRKDGRITKKELKDLALQDGLIHIESAQNEEQAGYMALNKNLIEPLLRWKFVDVKKIGARHVVRLSKEGENALSFLI